MHAQIIIAQHNLSHILRSLYLQFAESSAVRALNFRCKQSKVERKSRLEKVDVKALLGARTTEETIQRVRLSDAAASAAKKITKSDWQG